MIARPVPYLDSATKSGVLDELTQSPDRLSTGGESIRRPALANFWNML
jgi:hypothetical protein